VDKFVFEIAMDETGDKHKKLAVLQLSEAEWARVDLFLDLLAVRIFPASRDYCGFLR
jgi:hypothetical protein